jgi:transcriptional regulator with XRE-family HTH domain
MARKQKAQGEQFRDRLKTARLAAGVSHERLAAASGIYRANISRIESGKSDPLVSTVERLAAALGKRLDLVD